MPRAKDTKVWNEDLVIALRSREDQCRQRFSQRQYLWRDGAAAIASVRKDIFQFKTGKIVGLPRTLTKCVEEECRAIIEGKRPLLPEGYVPTTLEEQEMSSKGSAFVQVSNPYRDDPYLKRIKMRGGAYAILMAFHNSKTKTMTQKQICRAAQNYCDEEMEPNFYSGRSYGAWSSKKTLVKHGLIKESRTTQMGRHGIVCNGVFEYTLTENGKLFVEALLEKFPLSSDSKNNSCSQNENENPIISKKMSTYTAKKAFTKALNVKSSNTHVVKKSPLRQNDRIPNRSKNDRKIEDYFSLSDSDDDSFCYSSQLKSNYREKSHRERVKAGGNVMQSTPHDVIDLLDSSDEEYSPSNVGKDDHETKIERIEWKPKSYENTSLVKHPCPITKKAIILGPKLVILIDNRERNHNATPRHMRIELSRHLSKSTGSIQQVWPSHLPFAEVEEDQLNYGDFAFTLKLPESSQIRRLPFSIERKRLSDLVQRSSQAHHWQQLHRMRDCCEHAILLIEGNTKKTSNFSSYGDVGNDAESWNPDHHTIDDEHAFYRFLGRAILSSPALKVVQAKDEQASYRLIGATGLVASLMSWEKDAPRSVPTTKVTLNKLYTKLKSRGIPWQIARRISEELGSIQQLNKIYDQCEVLARPIVLVPTIREACSSMIETENSRSLLEYGTVEAWSSAIHSAWYSKIKDLSRVCPAFEENKYFANDRAQFLRALHRGKSIERAIQESNIADELTLRESKRPVRIVRIESSSQFSRIFPSGVHTETFYEIVSAEENPLCLILPSIVMQTNDGTFQSNKLVLCILEGSDLFQRIQDHAESHRSANFTDLSKNLAEQVNSESSTFLICPKKDRRVLIIRGLGSAMNFAAKQAKYRAEYRVLVDLVIAELMLRHNIVVIQAPRLENDLEMIVREFAMACFYYQKLTQKLR